MPASFDPVRRRVLAATGGAVAALALAPLHAIAQAGGTTRRSKLVLLGTAGGPTPKTGRAALSRVVDQDLAHRPRGDREEMYAVVQLVIRVGQAKVGFAHEIGCS